MQGNSVAFTIKHDRSIAVLADLLFRFQNFATVLLRGFCCFVQAPRYVEIKQQAGIGWLLIVAFYQASGNVVATVLKNGDVVRDSKAPVVLGWSWRISKNWRFRGHLGAVVYQRWRVSKKNGDLIDQQTSRSPAFTGRLQIEYRF